MRDNQLTRYGAIAKKLPVTFGKVFFLVGTTEALYADFQNAFPADGDGVERVYSTATSALAATTSGNGDILIISPGFTTALTAVELLAAETKGVTILQAGKQLDDGTFFSHRATAALPATTQAAIFTVTGRIEVLAIIGEVTTIIQTQLDNVKIVANPTVGADVDLCAVKDVTAAAVGTQFNITGTLATAMVQTASGAFVKQASPVVVMAGTIDLNASATNTGSVKWLIIYKPIDPGARVFAA